MSNEYKLSYTAAEIDGKLGLINQILQNVEQLEVDVNSTTDVMRGGTGVSNVAAGNFLVGNGTDSMVEMTPDEVLGHINGAAVMSLTESEYESLDVINGNTLYLLTDGEEESDNYVSTEDFEILNNTVNVLSQEIESSVKSDYVDGKIAEVQENIDTVGESLNGYIGDFNTHVNNTNIHVTSTDKINWDKAHTHSTSTHARTDATKVASSSTNGNILINNAETNVYTHPSSGVTTGTYKSVTVDAEGHVTAGSNPTTISGYGITDAYTKTEVDTKLSGKSDSTHNHDTAYDTKGAASEALADAKEYADATALEVKNDLLNGAGGAYDTLKELGDLIDDNTDAISALETVASNKANASDLTSHTGNKSNPHGVTAAQVGAVPTSRTVNGKALSSNISLSASDVGAASSTHGHAISEITNLQSSLDAKVPTSRTINGKALTGNITLSASDINSYSKTEIDNLELISVSDIDTICGASIQVASADDVLF